MIHIAKTDVVYGLNTLVALKGEDYVYPQPEGICEYVREGEPSCIVGRFLHAVGVPLERLAKADSETHGGGIAAYDLLRKLEVEGVVTFSGGDILHALAQAQLSQDDGRTWGFAVSRALQEL